MGLLMGENKKDTVLWKIFNWKTLYFEKVHFHSTSSFNKLHIPIQNTANFDLINSNCIIGFFYEKITLQFCVLI